MRIPTSSYGWSGGFNGDISVFTLPTYNNCLGSQRVKLSKLLKPSLNEYILSVISFSVSLFKILLFPHHLTSVGGYRILIIG